jgi:hypothetical protein
VLSPGYGVFYKRQELVNLLQSPGSGVSYKRQELLNLSRSPGSGVSYKRQELLNLVIPASTKTPQTQVIVKG